MTNNGRNALLTSRIKVHWTCSARTRCDVTVTLAAAGQCGSCWAFGTGGSFADRLCIASNASKVWPNLKAPLWF